MASSNEGIYPWYSERFDGRQPASFAYREWAMMLARNQKFLGVGMPRRDLAVLRTDYAFANYDVQLPGAEGSFRDNYSMHDQPYYWKDCPSRRRGTATTISLPNCWPTERTFRSATISCSLTLWDIGP